MIKLILTSLGLGAGLAMDACAVSMTNGLNEPKMKASKALLIAATFAVFQALMPLIGWLCVSLVADRFAEFAKWVPYIALVLLIIIGGKMLYDGISGVSKEKNQTQQEDASVNIAAKPLTVIALLAQAVATSIDALSTGFTLSDIAGNNFLSSVAVRRNYCGSNLRHMRRRGVLGQKVRRQVGRQGGNIGRSNFNVDRRGNFCHGRFGLV